MSMVTLDFKFPFFLQFLHMCECAAHVCMYLWMCIITHIRAGKHVYICICLYRPEADIKNLPPPWSTLYIEAGFLAYHKAH